MWFRFKKKEALKKVKELEKQKFTPMKELKEEDKELKKEGKVLKRIFNRLQKTKRNRK